MIGRKPYGWRIALTILSLLLLSPGGLLAQMDARMLRQPDVSQTHIAFVYADDIWIVSKTGGVAHQLSSPKGREAFPRFSPDGRMLAFTGNYDGNLDVYVLPTEGGTPERLTYHPSTDRIVDWYPDGKHLLLASSRESYRNRFNQFYKVPVAGGLPEKLPVPYGEFGSVSDDGKTLAYTMLTRVFRTWKRYRGGTAPDIYLFNLKTLDSETISTTDANDQQPMWHEDILYFLSDRGPAMRHNIWAYETTSKTARQVTHFTDFDVHFPAVGPADLVFEAGGKLYRLDLSDEQQHEVPVRLVTDESTLRPKTVKVADLIRNASLSPTGKRVVVEARGELFSLPAKDGVIRNLTRSPGVAERYPEWSPDGRYMAYWSDRSGEYELTMQDREDKGEEETLTATGSRFKYRLFWSPDSEKVAFFDSDARLSYYDVPARKLVKVDQADVFLSHSFLRFYTVSWSPDSRWFAYFILQKNQRSAIFLYDLEKQAVHQVTSAFYSDFLPVFDPDGKYLYFASARDMTSMLFSNMDDAWIFANTTKLYAASLRPDVPSPMAPRNDDEGLKEEDENGKDAGEEEEDGQKNGKKKGEKDENGDEAEKKIEIAVEGLESRVVELPVEAGNYGTLGAVPGKILYRRFSRTGGTGDPSDLVYFDLEEREEKTVIEGINGYRLSTDHKKLLVAKDQKYGVIDLKPDQKIDPALRTGELEMTVAPRDEWEQMFSDAWRLYRDYFYDVEMHGVDWPAMRQHYEKLLAQAVTRSDVNYVLGELIGELNSSHTYRGGGDIESAESKDVGLLGVDWEMDDGHYRIARIVRAAPWDTEVVSPLARPGVEAGEGDYVLAVNGVLLDVARDPWAAFQGLAEKTVELTVNDRPTLEGARSVLVKTIRSEGMLRQLAWVEANRKRVNEASGGRIGYVYVQDTAVRGHANFIRQFTAQIPKQGLIIDERFNSGGFLCERLIEILQRPEMIYWSARRGDGTAYPQYFHVGPKAMLINAWSGSGGDGFPTFFKLLGIGPVIGTRTWGGEIGLSGQPLLVDGGVVTVPSARMYYASGNWFEEGHGVDPDIQVPEDPASLARGVDPQLEKAIQVVLDGLDTTPGPGNRPPARERRARQETGVRQASK